MDRIKKLCGFLDKCESFADIGCDHGYCTLYMLKNGLCKTAVIADISDKCLNKAERLLSDYIKCGRVSSFCCNGLKEISPDISQVLIAGMGGEEIVNILKTAYIPVSFVFQPMKNAQKLREYLIACGAEITLDKPFESGGKFYYVIKGIANGKSEYTRAQLAFGKDLNCAETKAYIGVELQKLLQYSKRKMSEAHLAEINNRITFIQKVLQNEIK